MSTELPIFTMTEPQHFNDYGFDPQIDYFQVLEEARKHKRETSRSIDALHFKLQKPISKDESKKIKKNKKRWWRNALLFFRWKWTHNDDDRMNDDHNDGVLHRTRAFRGSISGPVYITESSSGSTTSIPYQTSRRPLLGSLARTLTSTKKGELEIPYMSLRELNKEQQHRMSTSALPIYFVT